MTLQTKVVSLRYVFDSLHAALLWLGMEDEPRSRTEASTELKAVLKWSEDPENRQALKDLINYLDGIK